MLSFVNVRACGFLDLGFPDLRYLDLKFGIVGCRIAVFGIWVLWMWDSRICLDGDYAGFGCLDLGYRDLGFLDCVFGVSGYLTCWISKILCNCHDDLVRDVWIRDLICST